MNYKGVIDELCRELNDEMTYVAWRSNIAMSFIDTFRNELGERVDYKKLHRIANKAADHFLETLKKKG